MAKLRKKLKDQKGITFLKDEVTQAHFCWANIFHKIIIKTDRIKSNWSLAMVSVNALKLIDRRLSPTIELGKDQQIKTNLIRPALGQPGFLMIGQCCSNPSKASDT